MCIRDRNKGHRSCIHHPKSGEESTLISEVSYLCTAAFTQRGKMVVNHHIFDKVHGWIESPSKPHPTTTATAKAVVEDHESKFKTPIKNPNNLKSLTAPMVTDSGCQSTIAPASTIYSMGYKKPDLIKVRMKMSGAGDDDLGIIGAVIWDVELKDCLGNILKTRQLCYVSTRVKKIFLFRQSLEDLKIIRKDFPKPMTEGSSVLGTEEQVVNIPCSCPRRSPTPPKLSGSLPEGLVASLKALREQMKKSQS